MATVIDNIRFRKLLRAYPIKAIELLYDLYFKRLVRLATSLTHDSESAEDIVQETFLNVWIKRVELSEDHESLFEQYLVSVVRNKAISFYNKTKLENNAYSNAMTNQAHTNTGTIENDIIQGERVNEIRRVIARFPKTERECLQMNIDKGMTIDQIADHQGVTRKAVEGSLTRARKRLREWFNK